jgi:aryl-alcohol dehydrogenase-like predicted oxidoreductase
VTAIDTAYSYSGFAGVRLLAKAAGDLLDRIDITTKIGYFPGGHDLSETALREAAQRTVDELGRAPDTLLLHNPEVSADQFTTACHTMTRLRDEGLCRAWGVSTWNPRPLLGRESPEPPDVLMVRCGLLVPNAVLDSAEQLAAAMRPGEVRGMAPFGGNPADPVWSRVDTTLFLSAGQEASRVQAAVAVAYRVPEVTAVAVGTCDPRHLADLTAAASLEVNSQVVRRYRALIHQRAAVADRSAGSS